ncbi:DUF3549 family protein [Agarivorans sp. 1_MG-2023]|uniref:DUF3549 family protein n=1 Tax=Agarivorans sp. 1_MG-2023 TaxID=3062634 RepID=UPI0026E377BB|nr:DUF3549 family protein [Agarivorans sp. 1_MG-2023]MDO6765036.1 DUF3549 family protein [Agarivorans sp. 1_MG-2023]
MKKITTLSEILQLSGSELRVYEMGRQIHHISNQDFYQIETSKQPYPAPIQQHARFALCFWQKQQSDTPYIWFLQLPVDEQGFINLGARDQFIQLVIDAMGHQLNQEPTEEQQQALANNQYIYKPIEEKLAYFNAVYKKDCQLPPSEHYLAVRRYLSADSSWDNWQALALQGVADVIARLDRDENSKLLSAAFHKLPIEVANKTLELLEHASIDQQLSQCVAQSHAEQLEKDEELASLYLRALAGSSVTQQINKSIMLQLENAASIHSFIAVAGRLWQQLAEPNMLKAFLEALSKQQDPELFQQIFTDLVFIPSLRSFVLAQLRDPSNSPELQVAIQQLLDLYQTPVRH